LNSPREPAIADTGSSPSDDLNNVKISDPVVKEQRDVLIFEPESANQTDATEPTIPIVE
jgi:hypothetical protein